MSATAGLARGERLTLPRRLALAAETLMVYARVRRLLRSRDIRAAIADLRTPAPAGATDSQDRYASAVRLGRVVTRVLEPLPVNSGCLPVSLVLCAMLARRGVESAVVIGVRSGSSFGAHAWVELDGRPLLPAAETEFERLVAL